MVADRFVFQRQCVQDALDELDGEILNVGCNDDPGHLKQIAPALIVNCDLMEHDEVVDRPNLVDVVFDAARDEWPFESASVAMVLFGDIVEHLTPEEMRAAFTEARRVGRRLCITCPEDHRSEVNNERADTYPRGAVHRTTVTRTLLEELLEETGWSVTAWEEVLYDDGRFWGERTTGHWVVAE